MTELEHAIKHIKTRADTWAVKEVTEALQSISERMDKALSQKPCIYDLKNRYCPRLNEHGMLKELEQQPTDVISLEAVIEWLKDKDIIKLSSQEETARKELKALSQEPTDTWSIKDVADTFKKHGLIREQEPCDDVVSRNMVLSEVKSGMIRTIDGENWKRVNDNVRDILALPPVTPQ